MNMRRIKHRKEVRESAKKLVSDEGAEKFFKLYYEGKSKREIAQACGVPIDAVTSAYPEVHYGERGKIEPPFTNKNPGKHIEKHSQLQEAVKESRKKEKARKKTRDEEIVRLQQLKLERKEVENHENNPFS